MHLVDLSPLRRTAGVCASSRAFAQNHILRTLADPEVMTYCDAHDQLLLGALCSLIQYQSSLRPEQVMLASLPCRYSGLGLRSARRTAPAAYFGG